MPVSGHVRWFDPARCYGFIEADDGKGDVQLHVNALRAFGFETVAEGSRIVVEVEVTARGRRATKILDLQPPPGRAETPPADAGPLLPARVRWFNRDQGYGFVNVFRSRVDVFLHMATLQALDVFRDTSPGNLLRLYRTHPRARWAEGVEWAFDDLSPARYVAQMPSLPLLIVNGGRDPIARRWHGERLYERAREPKEWRVVRPASHLTLIFLPETAQLVGEWFLKNL